MPAGSVGFQWASSAHIGGSNSNDLPIKRLYAINKLVVRCFLYLRGQYEKLSLVVATSFAFLSFSAFAGGNCIYGHDAKIAQSNTDEVLYDEELVDPKLLALLKKQQESKVLIKPIATFN